MQEKDKMFAWARTLLSVYKYLETVTNAIDNLVLKQGINSSFYSNGLYNSTYQCANKIIELTDRKQNLINIKVIVEDCLAKLPVNDVRLLVLTYFDLLKSSLIGETLNISVRTYFRRKNVALVKFSNSLKNIGFTSDKLFNSLEQEGWLINIFENNLKSIVNSEDSSLNVNEYKLLKFIMKDLNKTTYKTYSY